MKTNMVRMEKIVWALRQEIATYNRSYREGDGVIRDASVLETIAALRAAIRIIKSSKRTVIRIHVRGGVAYPPDRCPPGVSVKIIDHD